MVVALGTAHGRPQPHRREVSHPIRGVLGQILPVLRAALVRRLEQSVVARRDLLVDRRRGQQVSRQLLRRETVERHVVAQGPDDPVAIGGDVVLLVAVITHRAGVPHQVEPVRRQALTVMGRGEETFHQSLVGVGARVAHERLHVLRGGRQAREVERQPADQGHRVRLRRRGEAAGLELRQDEAVHRPPGPRRVADLRDRRSPGRGVRPVLLVFRALLDPAAKDVDLPG